MIKINLAGVKAKGRSFKAQAMATADVNSIEAEDLTSARSVAIKNLAIILLGPILLLVYEQINLPELQGQIQKISSEYNELLAKNNKAKEAVAQTARFRKEQELLQAQISSLENLKKDRLREVKVLDFIQKDLPEKVWLSRMELLDGKLVINGFAVTDSDLTLFMDSLSRSAYLKEVSLIRSVENNSKDFGNVKKFEVSCLMERTP